MHSIHNIYMSFAPYHAKITTVTKKDAENNN